jgi:hypothetical protein
MKVLGLHGELATNESVGVLSNKCMLFDGVLFVQDNVAMLPLVPDHGRQFADQLRPTRPRPTTVFDFCERSDLTFAERTASRKLLK